MTKSDIKKLDKIAAQIAKLQATIADAGLSSSDEIFKHNLKNLAWNIEDKVTKGVKYILNNY